MNDNVVVNESDNDITTKYKEIKKTPEEDCDSQIEDNNNNVKNILEDEISVHSVQCDNGQ